MIITKIDTTNNLYNLPAQPNYCCYPVVSAAANAARTAGGVNIVADAHRMVVDYAAAAPHCMRDSAPQHNSPASAVDTVDESAPPLFQSPLPDTPVQALTALASAGM
jgi:hypothetical protein